MTTNSISIEDVARMEDEGQIQLVKSVQGFNVFEGEINGGIVAVILSDCGNAEVLHMG